MKKDSECPALKHAQSCNKCGRKCANLKLRQKLHDTECELFDEVCQNTENVEEHCAFTNN